MQTFVVDTYSAKGRCPPWLKVSPSWPVPTPTSFSATRFACKISFKKLIYKL